MTCRSQLRKHTSPRVRSAFAPRALPEVAVDPGYQLRAPLVAIANLNKQAELVWTRFDLSRALPFSSPKFDLEVGFGPMLTLEKSPGARQGQQQESGEPHPEKVSSAIRLLLAPQAGTASRGSGLRSPCGRER